MASLALAPTDKALSLLVTSFKDLSITLSTATPAVSELTANNKIITGISAIASHLASLIPALKNTTYTPEESAEIQKWLELLPCYPVPESMLDTLNETLKFRTTILGEKFSIADAVVYASIKNDVAAWSDEQRTGENGRRYVVRWLDFVQNSPESGLNVPETEKVKIDVDKVLFTPKPVDAPKKKKPAAAATPAAAGAVEQAKVGAAVVAETVEQVGKKVKDAAGAAQGQGKRTEKKVKQKREPPPRKEGTLSIQGEFPLQLLIRSLEPVISPAQIDLRVGHILYCRPHPNADSLFVSTIAMGDDTSSSVITPNSEITELPAEVLAKFNALPPVRTVCSGLNGLIPIEEMQNRKVVVVANLKPVVMRGIKSSAMVLVASPRPPPGEEASHKKFVELVSPPEGAQAGDKVYFEGYEGTPEAQLNPKKKIFEQIQPGFRTLEDDTTVAFDRALAGWVGPEGEKGKAKGEAVAKLVVSSGGVCKAPTLKGAAIS